MKIVRRHHTQEDIAVFVKASQAVNAVNPQGGVMNVQDKLMQLAAIGLEIEQLKIQRRIWAAEARLARATQEKEDLGEVVAHLAGTNALSPNVERAEERIMKAERRAEHATFTAERAIEEAKRVATNVTHNHPQLAQRPPFAKYSRGY